MKRFANYFAKFLVLHTALLFLFSCSEKSPMGSSLITDVDPSNKTVVYTGDRIGDFKEIGKKIDWKKAEKLVVKGRINNRDIRFMKVYALNPLNGSVKDIDLRDAEIFEGILTESFSDYKSLKSFIFPRKLNKIGDKLFPDGELKGELPQMTELILPEETEEIGDYFLNCCYHLTSWYINVKEENLEQGQKEMLEKLTKTKFTKVSLSIPHGVKRLGISAYSYYPFATIEIPESVESFGMGCFASSALEEFTIPSKINVIAFGLFYSCRRLKKVNIHDGVTEIQERAFYHSGIETLDMPQSVKSVGPEFVGETVHLKEIRWSKQIKELPREALARLYMEEFHLPEHITKLGDKCFLDCKTKRIYLHKNIEKLGKGVFNYSNELDPLPNSNFKSYIEEIHVAWDVPPTIDNVLDPLTFDIVAEKGMGSPNYFLPPDFKKVKLYVPRGSKTLYEKADLWNKFDNIIEE